MATLLAKVKDYYDFVFYQISDPRTENWWLFSGPGPLLSILAIYLYFCNTLGPRYMKHRKPYELKNVIMLYNVLQILLSMYLVYEGLSAGWWNDYSYTCQPVDYSEKPKAKRMLTAVWWYFAAKLTELLDTIFFVLRKKSRNVTFLHLYHHSIMPVCAWIAVKYVPGGHGTLLGLINSFIHIVMYTYYLIAGFGPQYQKYLWWKKHLTSMQLIQFCIIFIHNFSAILNNCNYPKFISSLLCLNAILFLYLFGVFYYNNYINNRKVISTTSSMTAKSPVSTKNSGTNCVTKNSVQNSKRKEG